MAALFWGKRITINISKTSSKDFPNHYFHSASRISRSRWLSSAYEHAHGSNAVAESTDHKAGTEASRDGLYEAKQEALDEDEGRPSGVTGFVADKVKDGARKAVDTAENVGDTAKQIMDGAWKAAKETTEKIKDNVICGDDGDRDHDHIDRDPSVFDAKKTSDPIDTQEYRSIEDQRNKAVLKKKKKTAVSEQLKIIKLSKNGNSIPTELKQQQKLIKQLLEIVETTTNKRKKKN